jgi:hypothetical protein
MELSHKESAILQQISYMDGLNNNFKDQDLQQIATEILKAKGTKKEIKLGKWGGFTLEEHYKTLEEIAKGKDGEYSNLSNLVFKATANDVGRTDFVAYAGRRPVGNHMFADRA